MQMTPAQQRAISLNAAHAVLNELRYTRQGYAYVIKNGRVHGRPYTRQYAAEQLDRIACHRRIAAYLS